MCRWFGRSRKGSPVISCHYDQAASPASGNGEPADGLSLVLPVALRPAAGSQSEARGHRIWCLLLAPIAGWGCYLVLMWRWTGNPFEGFEAQQYWGVNSISNLWNVPKFVIGLFTPTAWHAYNGSLLDRCVFILLVYCLALLWRQDRELFLWAWVLGIVPAMSGTCVSLMRYGSVAFPMFVALGLFLSRPERRWLRILTFALFGILHVVLLWRFVSFRWAG